MSPRTGCRPSGRVVITAVFLLLILTIAAPAAAYTENMELERALGSGDAKALALFPAKGFKDGAAGFFRTHGLYVVPGSPRAWCSDRTHGILKPGCYVEFFVQGEGLKPRSSHGKACGGIGRWYQAPGLKSYAPTPGPFISNAIANGEWDRVVSAIYQEPSARSLPTDSCDRTTDR